MIKIGCFNEILAGIALLVLLCNGCTQQTQAPPGAQAANNQGDLLLVGTRGVAVVKGDTIVETIPGEWLWLEPPQRTYAADRTWQMGGPVATAPMEGADSRGAYFVYSLDQLDMHAPLSKWPIIGSFQSQQECENAKAAQLKQVQDPAWLAQQALKVRTRLVSGAQMRNWVGATRCVAIKDWHAAQPK